ncbi:MAG: glycosyltransferase family 4 protein [Lentisphaeria bacterium]|nr:glycosyltransferase family 4 protein [Lentisphaeria bacterium]NQZ71392.1 glycosyltransferase family 4 protein [Lentisphaeria bacterium]
MRVLFLYSNEKLASTRIRILNLIPYLSKKSIACTAIRYKEFEIKDAANYDMLVIQKKMVSMLDYWKLKKLKIPIVFDFDDAIFSRDKEKNGSYVSRSRQTKFNQTKKLADAFICGNKYLASFCPDGTNIVVAPSPVPHELAQKNYSRANQPIRIGWVGSASTLPMLERIDSELNDLQRSHPFELHIIADRNYAAKNSKLQIVNHRWEAETQEAIIAEFDIGIMPLQESPWTLGKCSYKLLQYMAASIPALGSNIGMNQEIIQHNKNGILVDDGDWAKALSELIMDPNKRKMLGTAGRKTILENHTYDVYTQKWYALIQKLL